MLKIIKNKVILLLILLCCFSNIRADETDEDPYFPSRTSAMDFTKQAALIGGAAKACGQDISVFINRVNQALNKFSLSSGDKVLVMAHFQKALVQSQTAQIYRPAVSCAQVMHDYNNLPLMLDDYQQSVMPKLNPAVGQNPTQPLAPGPPYPSPVTASVGENPPPNINALAPAGLPPPPPTHVDSNAQNILFSSPGVAPTVDTTKPAPNINYLAPNPFTKEPPPVNVSNPYAGTPPQQ